MAFDYGSQSLGIPNPFKTEGKIRLLAGILITALSVLPLISISATLKENPARAWGQVVIGLFLMTWGLRTIAVGAMQLFRFYVGRSVPSSLAFNRNASERENAEIERTSGSLAYNSERLESMMMGRKNTTFSEPLGWMSRLVHSLIPRLVLAPYPVRNFVQELAGVVASTLVALVAFGLSYFVTATGLAGDSGDFIIPVMSLLLLVYLVFIWRTAAKNMVSERSQDLHKKGVAGISRLFVFALVVPVLLGYGYSWVTANSDPHYMEQANSVINSLLTFSAWLNLGLLLIAALIVVIPTFFLVRERLKMAVTSTSVSEFRENMQESVHPNEIFINTENIVLANRRYKEVPNRVYRDFEPRLEEQGQGKGTFNGQLLIETQPAYQPMTLSGLFKKVRLFSTIGGQLLTVGSAALLYVLFNKGFTVYHDIKGLFLGLQHSRSSENVMAFFTAGGQELSTILTLLFTLLTVAFTARMLSNLAHMFWSEIQFDSLLMSVKMEGTYTESKISTGMAYNDSTRSENVVVRTSMTPWILTSRILTSTYATSGMKNLEMPRLIMSMDANDQELDTIIGEMRDFLRERESIASINNEKDLANAERIYQVNSISKSDNPEQAKLTDQATSGQLEDLSESEGEPQPQ